MVRFLDHFVLRDFCGSGLMWRPYYRSQLNHCCCLHWRLRRSFLWNLLYIDAMYIKEEKCLKLFKKIVKHLGLWQKVRKNFNFSILPWNCLGSQAWSVLWDLLRTSARLFWVHLEVVRLIPKNAGTLKSLKSQF